MQRYEYLEKLLSQLVFSNDEAEVIRGYYAKEGSGQSLDHFSVSYICAVACILNFVKSRAFNGVDNFLEPVKPERNNGFEQSITMLRMLISAQKTGFIIPYDFIAYYVYQDDECPAYHSFEKAYEDFVGGVNHQYFETLESDGHLDEKAQEDIEKIFNKIKRNALLAIHQKQYILQNIERAQDDVKSLEKEISSLRAQANTFLNRLQNTTGTYVAILGIFATIIFAVVGTLSLMSSAAAYIKSKQEFMLYVSTGLLGLCLVIYFLFSWIDILKRETTRRWWHIVWNGVKFIVFLGGLSGIAYWSFTNDGKQLNRFTVDDSYSRFTDTPFNYSSSEVWSKSPSEMTIIRVEE